MHPFFCSVFYTVYTFWLFNCSDMKTIVYPVGVFAASLTSPKLNIGHIAAAVCWIWFVLLGVSVTNQSLGDSPQEDSLNKPYRPIPAKRISVNSARALRWWLIPATICYSAVLHPNSLTYTVSIAALTFLYNECGGHSHWLTKNMCCGAYYFLFELIHGDFLDGMKMQNKQYAATITSACIICTSAHAQDFRDMRGDAMKKRSTLPLSFPSFSRLTMPILLIAWSFVLGYVCHTNATVHATLLLLAFVTGVRFLAFRDPHADQTSYNLYNVSIWVWFRACEICVAPPALHLRCSHVTCVAVARSARILKRLLQLLDL
ncbi:hypothetical protein K435DRAFT_671769 [Dendrothele bispora CBS 962.96]|uniref:UbiA prenyltransferase n=1 Tax=Dendrothele bispora (strain CBS 962.96) TaxID=1314807 RepID=A0A4S8LUF5_DENBC|nr:hypothetical protein K435DRAFT_671769 [Dendrothele bispora CBS 962.96]